MKLARFVPLVLLALVGCSPSPTTAAQVGDVTISTQTVSDVVASCPLFIEQGGTEQMVLNSMILMVTYHEAAERSGIELDEDELRSILLQDENARQILTEQPGCTDILLPSLAEQYIAGTADPKEVIAVSEELEVAVNPRYGTWSRETVAVDSGVFPLDSTMFAVDGSGSVSAEA